ncbi:hypothetical protein AXF42_Ash010213 [Apostasia shenzhenica]|uniref:Uncharacterized protein n=1 Tax=Apostasia shenzhenica TaxID=1088818 RepID=A0A2I0A9U1_9ASPA|nr:hypothetical protein AXF42_Ash010213 [Apostasia shenzhenica]
MAEARREIITALKFHRAAMKQANERQKQQNLHQPPASAPSSEESSLGLVLESLKSNAIFHPKPMASSYPYLSYPLSESSPVSQILHLHQLNVHEFAAETSVFGSGKAPPSQFLSSSSSSSTAANSNASVDPALHPAMGDEEMAEIRSVSEKHDIEWDDMMSLVTTARWSKFLKAMEVDRGDNGGEGGEGLEIPPWLNDGIVMDD